MKTSALFHYGMHVVLLGGAYFFVALFASLLFRESDAMPYIWMFLGAVFIVAVFFTWWRSVYRRLMFERKNLENFLTEAVVGIQRIAFDGTILWTNNAAAKLLGYGVHEYTRRSIKDLFLNAHEGKVFAEQFLRKERIINREVVMRHKDGTPRYVRISADIVDWNDIAPHYRSFLFDVTEEKKQENSTKLMDAVSRAIIKGKQDPISAMRAVARLLVTTDLAEWCAIDVVDEGRITETIIENKHKKRLPPITPPPHRRNISFEEGATERVIRTGKVQFYRRGNKPHGDSPTGEKLPRHVLFNALTLSSAVVIPFSSHRRIIGALILAHTESDEHYTQYDVKFLEELAHRITVSLENIKLVQKLQIAEKVKDEFLAKLSHELRNPLAAILSSAEVIRATAHATNEATAHYPIKIITHQTEYLARLLDDLLDVSLISQGTVKLNRERVDLRDVVTQAVETIYPIVQVKKQQIFVTLPPHALYCNVDLRRLEQVVINLLSNASKYTHIEGKIHLYCGRVGNEVVLRVKDTGIGIPQEALPKIFNPFTRILPAEEFDSAERTPGLGIGLNLVKTFVELHGGTVVALSGGADAGSEFIVRLPLSGNNTRAGLVSKSSSPHVPNSVVSNPNLFKQS